MSIFMSRDSRFFRALGEASKLGEDVYPQLVWKQVFMDAPVFFKALMAVARIFMSKRSIEKVEIFVNSAACTSAPARLQPAACHVPALCRRLLN